ncbi:MAG: hypothetical protein SGBAC_009604 [Bacillariaceae sp.]
MFDETNQFPWKLHILLEEAERNQDAHDIISWLPDGDAFKVHNKVEFGNIIMPKYFNSNKYKSFQRNLNLWGFQTLTKNPNKGAIFHPDFLRGKPDRCKLMKRVRVKKKTPKMSLTAFQAATMRAETTLSSSSSPSLSNTKRAPTTQKTSALKAAQPTMSTEKWNVRLRQREQREQEHYQKLVQNISPLSHSSRSSSPPDQVLENMMLLPRTPSISLAAPIYRFLLLNRVAQKQVQAPSLFASPWSKEAAVADRLKMQVELAVLITNTPIHCPAECNPVMRVNQAA